MRLSLRSAGCHLSPCSSDTCAVRPTGTGDGRMHERKLGDGFSATARVQQLYSAASLAAGAYTLSMWGCVYKERAGERSPPVVSYFSKALRPQSPIVSHFMVPLFVCVLFMSTLLLLSNCLFRVVFTLNADIRRTGFLYCHYVTILYN